jgi:hypothetical protein
MYLKTKETHRESGNPVEKKGTYEDHARLKGAAQPCSWPGSDRASMSCAKPERNARGQQISPWLIELMPKNNLYPSSFTLYHTRDAVSWS